MPTVPTKTLEYLQWAQQRSATWGASPTTIGLTTQLAAQMTTAVEEMAAAIAARAKAESELEAAKLTQENAVRASRRVTSDLIRSIRAFASNSADPDQILNLAEIPPIAPAAPAPPPAKPTNMTVGIDPSTGAITLKWKASNPAGTSNTGYIIRRRVGSTGAFDFVGVTGDKNFTDNTFIAGPDSVQYTVQGQRGGTLGPLSDILVINFGRVGPGLTGPQRDYTVEGGEKEEGASIANESKQQAA
jgi:hypothetical protein